MLHNVFKQRNLGRVNWASDVKRILYHFGFGYVWEQQGVTNCNSFLDQFKTRLLDCDRQLWSMRMTSLPILRTLLLFKLDLVAEPYLYLFFPHR
jgi:hypothetical protein